MELQHTRIYGGKNRSSKREAHSNEWLRNKKNSNKLPKLILKELDKEEQRKSKVSRSKEIKIIVEINETET